MASQRRRKAKSPDALRMGKLRDHYHRHRVEVGDKWYNPLLDDPNHPDNIRHWTHGTVEGYFTAGCTACVECAKAGREENKRRIDRRVAAREREHQDRAAAFLKARFAGLPDDIIDSGAELVASTRNVRQRYRAIFDYGQVSIKLALEKWANEHNLHVDPGVLEDFAADLVAELTS